MAPSFHASLPVHARSARAMSTAGALCGGGGGGGGTACAQPLSAPPPRAQAQATVTHGTGVHSAARGGLMPTSACAASAISAKTSRSVASVVLHPNTGHTAPTTAAASRRNSPRENTMAVEKQWAQNKWPQAEATGLLGGAARQREQDRAASMAEKEGVGGAMAMAADAASWLL